MSSSLILHSLSQSLNSNWTSSPYFQRRYVFLPHSIFPVIEPQFQLDFISLLPKEVCLLSSLSLSSNFQSLFPFLSELAIVVTQSRLHTILRQLDISNFGGKLSSNINNKFVYFVKNKTHTHVWKWHFTVDNIRYTVILSCITV